MEAIKLLDRVCSFINKNIKLYAPLSVERLIKSGTSLEFIGGETTPYLSGGGLKKISFKFTAKSALQKQALAAASIIEALFSQHRLLPVGAVTQGIEKGVTLSENDGSAYVYSTVFFIVFEIGE